MWSLDSLDQVPHVQVYRDLVYFVRTFIDNMYLGYLVRITTSSVRQDGTPTLRTLLAICKLSSSQATANSTSIQPERRGQWRASTGYTTVRGVWFDENLLQATISGKMQWCFWLESPGSPRPSYGKTYVLATGPACGFQEAIKVPGSHFGDILVPPTPDTRTGDTVPREV